MPNDISYSPFGAGALSFPTVSLALIINPAILTIVLFLFLVVYFIITVVLMYHWSAYGMRSAGILVGETLFILVSLVLFMVASLSIYYF